MKTGSGCSNRAGTLGENGLVALAIRSFIGTFDVRWKRNMTEALKMLAEPNTAMTVGRVLASHGQQMVLLAAG